MELLKGEPAYYGEALYKAVSEHHIDHIEAKQLSIFIINEMIESHRGDLPKRLYYFLAKEYLKTK